MGVRRAVEMAEAEAEKNSGRVFTYGPLIHNPDVLGDLKKKGVEALDKPFVKPEGECAILIRAHGIQPLIETELRDTGCRIVDATCPHVKISQTKAEELASAGYFIFLAGEEKHAEIKGIMGYAQLGYHDQSGEPAPFCMVVSDPHEAGIKAGTLYRLNHDVKTALLGQTTISEEEYNSIAEAVKNFFPNTEIIQTICGSSTERQQALRELLDEAEAVIVAGGKDSANTRRLLEIAAGSGKPCVSVEKADEIPESFFKYSVVGLSAGASTPDCVIEKIENMLKKY